MSLTEQQRLAAEATGSVAIIAGAGAGKTKTLSERYLFHLNAHGLSPLQIVAITFTEKATAELQARIRQHVATHLPDRPDRHDLLAELEVAPISTIHALAARICREHPEAAGVSPGFAVLDDVEATIWQAEKLDEAMDVLPGHIYDAITYSRLRTILESLLEDPVTATKALAKDTDHWESTVAEARRQALETLISDPNWVGSRQILQRVTGAAGDLIERARQDAVHAITQLELGADPGEMLQALKGIRLQGGRAGAWPEGGLAEVKGAIKDLKSLADEAIAAGIVTLALGDADDRLRHHLPLVKEAYERVSAHLAAARRRSRVLDYAALEVHALQALSQADVLAYYHARWKAFLVDEFQDTNPVQAELLARLTAQAIVTVVGDEQQSIYGFRRADVSVFRRVGEAIASHGGTKAVLNKSFRSHRPLVRTFEQVFAPLLGDMHQAMVSDREAPHPGPHLRAYAMDKGQTSAGKSQLQRAEARHIARQLKAMLDDQWPVHRRGQRAIEYGDIAILSRTWEPLEDYAEALEEAGIPAVLAGGGSLLDTREAKDALALLTFLADPADDLALATILRGPWFACSDVALTRIARTRPEGLGWWAHLKGDDSPDLGHPRHVLRQLLTARSTELPSRLLALADRLTGYSAVLRNLPNAHRRQADWDGFLANVRTLEGNGGDVFTVVRKLRRLIKADQALKRPPLATRNAVTLMTIHSAKGLEWPVVIVPDLARPPSNQAPDVYFDTDLGLAYKVDDEQGEAQKPALYQILAWRRKQSEAAEARRLIYVALTRAGDHLILTATHPEQATMKWLGPALAGAGVTVEPVPYDPADAMPPALVSPALPAPSRLLVEPIGKRLDRLPITALSVYAACPRQFEFRFVAGHPGIGEGEAIGKRLGSLTHAALEHGIREVETLARIDSTLPRELVREAIELARRFDEDDAYAGVRGPGTSRETRVRLDRFGLRLSGSVDLVGDAFVLDYKTDATLEPDNHRFQLWAYAEALGRPMAHMAYLRHGYLHTIGQAELAELAVETRHLVEQIKGNDFTARPSAGTCGQCPYREICPDEATP